MLHTLLLSAKPGIATWRPSGDEMAQVMPSPFGSHSTLALPVRSVWRRTEPAVRLEVNSPFPSEVQSSAAKPSQPLTMSFWSACVRSERT